MAIVDYNRIYNVRSRERRPVLNSVNIPDAAGAFIRAGVPAAGSALPGLRARLDDANARYRERAGRDRDRFRAMMDEKGWDYGEDDEELFELAMHERQYLDYRSGIAKERFNKELADLKAKAGAPIVIERPVVEMPAFNVDELVARYPKATPVQCPAKGQMLWELDVDDVSMAPVTGRKVAAGEVIGHVQTFYGLEDIVAAADGLIVATTAKQGDKVDKAQIVAFIQ